MEDVTETKILETMKMPGDQDQPKDDDSQYTQPEAMPTSLIVMLCILFILHVVCLLACCFCGRARRKPNPVIVPSEANIALAQTRSSAGPNQNFTRRPTLDFFDYCGMNDRIFGPSRPSRTIVYLPPATTLRASEPQPSRPERPPAYFPPAPTLRGNEPEGPQAHEALQRNGVDLPPPPPPPYDYDPPPPYPGYDGPIYSIPLPPYSPPSSQGQRT